MTDIHSILAALEDIPGTRVYTGARAPLSDVTAAIYEAEASEARA